MKYNEEHHITPKQVSKDIKQNILVKNAGPSGDGIQLKKEYRPYIEADEAAFAADCIIDKLSREQQEKSIERTTQLMKQSAKELDFIQAAQYRDEIVQLRKILETK